MNRQNQLRILVREHLSACNRAASPQICAEIQSRSGYKRIEEMIITMALRESISIGTAINAIESELL